MIELRVPLKTALKRENETAAFTKQVEPGLQLLTGIRYDDTGKFNTSVSARYVSRLR